MYKRIIAIFLVLCMGMMAGCAQKPAAGEKTSQTTAEEDAVKDETTKRPEQENIVLTTDTKNLPYDMTEFSIDINVENAVLKDPLAKEMIVLSEGAENMHVTEVTRLSDTSLSVKAQGNVAEYVRKNYTGSVAIQLADAFVTDMPTAADEASQQSAFSDNAADESASADGSAQESASAAWSAQEDDGIIDTYSMYASLSVPIVFPRVSFRADTLTVSDGTAQFEIDLENAVFEQGLSADNFELSYTGDGEADFILKEAARKDDNVIQVKIAVNTDDVKEVRTLLKDYKLYIMPEAFSASDRLTAVLSCPMPDLQAVVAFMSTDEKGTDLEINLSLQNGSFDNVTKEMMSFEDQLAGAQDIKVESKDDAVTVSLHVPEVLDEESFYGVIALDGGIKDLYGETAKETVLVTAQDDAGDRLFAELAAMSAKQIAVFAAEAAIKKVGSKAADMGIDKVLGEMGLNTEKKIYEDTEQIKETCNEINSKCDEIKSELSTVNNAMNQYFSSISAQVENLNEYVQNRDLNNKITSFDGELGDDTMIALCRYNDLFAKTVAAYSEMVASYDLEKQDYDAAKKIAYERAYNRLIDQLSATAIRGRDIVHAAFAIGRAVMGTRTNRSFIYDYDEIVMPQYNFEEASYQERNNYRNSIKTLYERAVTWSIYLLSATGEENTKNELLAQEAQVIEWFENNQLVDTTPDTVDCLTYGVLVNKEPVASDCYHWAKPNFYAPSDCVNIDDVSIIFATLEQWKELEAHAEKFNMTLYEEMKLAGFGFKEYTVTEDRYGCSYNFSGYYILPRQNKRWLNRESVDLEDLIESDKTIKLYEYEFEEEDMNRESMYVRYHTVISVNRLGCTEGIHFYTDNGQDKMEITDIPTVRVYTSRIKGDSYLAPQYGSLGGYGIYYTIAK